MSHTRILFEIRSTWPAIVAAAAKHGYRYAPDVAMPGPSSELLGSSSKVRLGADFGVLTRVCYLSPARESGINTCPFRQGCGCEASCIGTSTGLLAMPSSKVARLWKTALVFGAPRLARELLHAEVQSHIRAAAKAGLRAAVRLDGSSDLGWGAEFAAEYAPTCTFYDYTKSSARAFASLGTAHHVTLSSTGRNDAQCRAYLAAGGTVAAVFAVRKGEPLPATWHGHPVVSGDEHDCTFLQQPGTVLGLAFKRAAKREAFVQRGQSTGFVLPVIH